MSDETSTQTQNTESAPEATTVNDGGETQSVTTYANGKYESVSALETGYSELQKSYSQKLGGFTGAPEAYILSDGIDSNSRIESLQKWGMDNNLSNDALNGIIAADQEASVVAQDNYVLYKKEILLNFEQKRITNKRDWGRANLGEENMEAFNAMVTSAKGVELFEKLSKMSQGTAAAQVAQPKTMVDRDSIREMRFAMDNYGERKMSSDPQYRAKVEKMEAEFIGGGGKL